MSILARVPFRLPVPKWRSIKACVAGAVLLAGTGAWYVTAHHSFHRELPAIAAPSAPSLPALPPAIVEELRPTTSVLPRTPIAPVRTKPKPVEIPPPPPPKPEVRHHFPSGHASPSEPATEHAISRPKPQHPSRHRAHHKSASRAEPGDVGAADELNRQELRGFDGV